MILLHWVIFLLFFFGCIVNGYRWSRIAQREHYIPGSVSKFYLRWIKLKKINYLILLILLIFIFLSLLYELASLVVILLVLIFPYGLTYKTRTSDIEITWRLKRCFFVYMLFITFFSLLFLINDLGYFGALVSFLFSFFIYDRALKLMFNIEKRLSNVYVESATEELTKLKGPIVAITGSYSKTTTKEVLVQILNNQYNIFSTPNSFNNRLGIARAINDSDMSKVDLAVVEMGTYGKGEIKEISSWLKPHIAVITGIGPVHLERMKTYENILDAKSEIVEYAGAVVINGDDEFLIERARTWLNTKQIIDCSIENGQALVYVDYKSGWHSVHLEGKAICKIQAPEVQQLSIALSVGVLYVLDQEINTLLKEPLKLHSVKHRQSVTEGKRGQKIIDNTFNSNPYSVLSSLKLLKELAGTESRLWIVTPGMVELGSEQFSLNVAFANEAVNIVDGAFIVGLTNKRALGLGFIDSGVDIKYVKNRNEAVKILDSFVNENDVVLFENDLPDHYP